MASDVVLAGVPSHQQTRVLGASFTTVIFILSFDPFLPNRSAPLVGSYLAVPHGEGLPFFNRQGRDIYGRLRGGEAPSAKACNLLVVENRVRPLILCCAGTLQRRDGQTKVQCPQKHFAMCPPGKQDFALPPRRLIYGMSLKNVAIMRCVVCSCRGLLVSV